MRRLLSFSDLLASPSRSLRRESGHPWQLSPLAARRESPSASPAAGPALYPAPSQGRQGMEDESHLPAPQVTGRNALEFTAVHSCGDTVPWQPLGAEWNLSPHW